MEGLLFGGAYLRREICDSKSIRLALHMEGNLPFLLCFTLYFRAISKYKPPRGAYIWKGDLTEGFLCYEFGGLYLEGLLHGGVYFRNFTVLYEKYVSRNPSRIAVLHTSYEVNSVCKVIR